MDITKIDSIVRAFHFEVEIQPVLPNLPIVFQRRYEFATLSVQEQKFMLIKEKRTGSLDNFVKQAQAIQKQVGSNIILVFSALSDANKKKLLQAGISYLDYQENAYFPYLGFLFSNTVSKRNARKSLSPTEQKVLITLLLHGSSFAIEMDEISQLTGLAISSLYRIFKVFKERGWLTNKQKSYHFAKPRKLLFDEAKDMLQNPIREVVIMSDDDFQKFRNKAPFKMSNILALSHIGMLANTENNGNYALSKKEYKKIEKDLQQHIFQGYRLEVWDYEPIPFDYQQNGWSDDHSLIMVDPISLYLTLKDDEDPRIEEEVENLEHKISNMLGEEYAS